MKNIVILVNGTWNDDDNQERSLLTNVVWLRELCIDEPGVQEVWYTDGVGAGGVVDKALGGAFGRGLKKGICAGYRAASEKYEQDAKIYLFGFSRGAYTVRTIADMIAQIGLVDLTDVPKEDRDAVCALLYDVYRGKKDVNSIGEKTFFNAANAKVAAGTTPIHMVGVWDTVGTAGIPDHYVTLNVLDWVSKGHNWANTQISDVVQNARHAIAMDEARESFVPAFWTDEKGEMLNTKRVKQLWFSGVHTDVGGGYEHRDLGNIAMGWMTTEAKNLGLLLDPDPKRPIPEDRALGVVNDSMTSVFKKMWSRPRGVPNVSDPKNKELFHPSVLRRYEHKERATIPNWEAPDLKQGDTVHRVAKAAKRWNPMGVFVEPTDTLNITAEGVWYDLTREYTPDGTWLNQPTGIGARALDAHHIPNMVAGVARWLRRSKPYRRVPGGWRDPESKPFMLMGVVADGRGVRDLDGAILPDAHTKFEIGNGVRIGARTDHPLKRGGYLYCYPNDVWQFYDNNSGELDISITLE